VGSPQFLCHRFVEGARGLQELFVFGGFLGDGGVLLQEFYFLFAFAELLFEEGLFGGGLAQLAGQGFELELELVQGLEGLPGAAALLGLQLGDLLVKL
jgi:hypothetical protein